MTAKVPKEKKNLTYKDSGVNVEAGYDLIKKIGPSVKKTNRQEILSDVGSFAALSRLPKHIKNPILVTCTDGVGTKIEIAKEVGDFSTIGVDLVAMCVNDLITCGAEPLLFLDYYVTDSLNVDTAAEVINGIATGCLEAKCSLVGGETAEHPDSFPLNSFDIAGFSVGIVDEKKIIGKESAKVNDVLIGLASSGVHSNGFSLIRKIIEEPGLINEKIDNLTIGQRLLKPTKIYVKEVMALKEEINISAISHITGGGFYENIPRILTKDSIAKIQFNLGDWPSFKLFEWIKSKGNITDKEMFSTFNCGVGMILAVPQNEAKKALKFLNEMNVTSRIIGKIEPKNRGDSPIEIKIN